MYIYIYIYIYTYIYIYKYIYMYIMYYIICKYRSQPDEGLEWQSISGNAVLKGGSFDQHNYIPYHIHTYIHIYIYIYIYILRQQPLCTH
jgi:hypothetical protein